MSPINPSDHNFIRGTYAAALERLAWNQAGLPLSFDPGHGNLIPVPPYTPGGEGVGVVDAAGPGFRARRLLGKRVAFAAGPPMGAWQDWTVLDAGRVVPMPDAVSDEQAAGFFINPLTAWAMVHQVLRARPGGWLLQSGANGALGRMVIALGKQAGFGTINLVRSETGARALRAAGADHVFATEGGLPAREILALTGDQGANWALDCIGGDLLPRMLPLLARDGRMVVYGTLAGVDSTINLRDLMMPRTGIEGFFLGNWLAVQPGLVKLMAVRAVRNLLASGVLASPVGQVFPLERLHEALAASQVPGKDGKVLLDMRGGEEQR